MKMKKVLTMAWVLVVVLTVSAKVNMADADEGMKDMKMESKDAGQVRVELMTKPSPPKVGENLISVFLKDKVTGAALTKAAVRIEPVMSDESMKKDMHHQAPQIINMALEAGHTEYKAKVNFSDPGAWQMKVALSVNDAQHTVVFDILVAKSGPNWAVIGGFLGIILLIIIVALVFKLRSRRTQ